MPVKAINVFARIFPISKGGLRLQKEILARIVRAPARLVPLVFDRVAEFPGAGLRI